MIDLEALVPDTWFARSASPARTAVDRAAAEVIGSESTIDPLKRLLDPAFTETLWYYEGSRTEPEIPGNLHKKQVEALNAPFRSRFLMWGNQGGKTAIGAIDDVLFALGRHAVWSFPEVAAKHGLVGHRPPVLMWASALTWDLWQDQLLPELLTWIPDDRIIDAPEPYQDSRKRAIKIRADNGSVSKIVGKSEEQGRKKYQSARIHRMHYDEEHRKEIRDEVQPRLLRHGGHEITTATPLMGLTWMYHDIYEPWLRGQRPDVFISHAGIVDNPAIDDAEIDRMKLEFAGDEGQLNARLYGHFTQPSGIVLKFDPLRHLETADKAVMVEQATKQKWKHVCGIDFGYWRFEFVHGMIDRAERCHVVGDIFSQKQSMDERARLIHDHLTSWEATRENTRIVGDSANPTDINELNRALKKIGSPFRVRPVVKEKGQGGIGFVAAGVGRINNLLHRGALLFRRGMSNSAVWMRGQSVASEGRKMIGSRLLWEIVNWRYPAPKGDAVQKQNPDDDTADGADGCAALRYLIVSHYKAPKLPKREKKKPRNVDTTIDETLKRITEIHQEMRR